MSSCDWYSVTGVISPTRYKLRGNGPTNFPIGGFGANSVAVGDTNGDSRPDLITTNSDVSVLLNTAAPPVATDDVYTTAEDTP